MNFEPIAPQNRARANAFLKAQWFSTDMAVRGRVVDLTRANGVLALDGGEIVGLVTFAIEGDACEILSLDSLRENRGIGTALLERAVDEARRRGCGRVALITTNDNIRAIRFYQRRGFDMARLYRNAVSAARRLKPEIPLIGEDDIPLRHEIEFEMRL